jgi:hypothetical protein
MIWTVLLQRFSSLPLRVAGHVYNTTKLALVRRLDGSETALSLAKTYKDREQYHYIQDSTDHDPSYPVPHAGV